MTFRSGTNQLRGSGILLHRGTWLDSNQIQNIRNNISNKEHQYFNGEAMVSGPIRRGKTFFMGGYQGFYENIPFPVTRTVPTAAQLRGDFSQTTTANGTPILIYDPATTTCTANLSSCTRQPFPGNVIPENRWSPIARTLLPFIPRRTRRPATCRGRATSSTRRTSDAIATTRTWRASTTSSATTTGCRSATARTGGSSIATRTRCRNRRSGATTIRPIATTIWPRWMTTARSAARCCGTRAVSWDRFDEPHDKEYGNVDPQPAVHRAVSAHRPAVPADRLRRIRRHVSAHLPPAAGTTPTRRARRCPKTMGRHFWEDRRRVPRLPVLPPGRSRLRMACSDPRQPVHPPRSAHQHRRRVGQRIRDVPARPADQRQRARTGTPRTEQYRYYALFVQDDWKIGSRATLNVGLRWDYQPPVTVEDDLTVSGFDFEHHQSAAVAAAAGGRDDQPGDRPAADAHRRPAVREPRRPEVAVQVGLEQHPAARRLHLQDQQLAGRPHQLRPVLSGSVERRPERRLHDRLPAHDAVHRVRAERHRPGTPWANPFPSGFLAAARR